MFKEIVVAVDGSDQAENALRTACDITLKYEARLHLVHVPEVYDQAMAVGSAAVVLPVHEDTLAESGQRIMERAVEIAEGAGVTPATSDICAGPAAPAILSVADDRNADLIVSGRRGWGNLMGALLGSVSQSIASGAECAVLTVK
jgi:nucleotide-binding universal stress UspA family protein